MNETDRNLLMTYSGLGITPEWHPDGAGHFEPVFDGRGKVKQEWKYPASRTKALYCHVRFEGTRYEVVSYDRQRYSAWWLALKRVQTALWGNLLKYEIKENMPQKAPWL